MAWLASPEERAGATGASNAQTHGRVDSRMTNRRICFKWSNGVSAITSGRHALNLGDDAKCLVSPAFLLPLCGRSLPLAPQTVGPGRPLANGPRPDSHPHTHTLNSSPNPPSGSIKHAAAPVAVVPAPSSPYMHHPLAEHAHPPNLMIPSDSPPTTPKHTYTHSLRPGLHTRLLDSSVADARTYLLLAAVVRPPPSSIVPACEQPARRASGESRCSRRNASLPLLADGSGRLLHRERAPALDRLAAPCVAVVLVFRCVGWGWGQRKPGQTARVCCGRCR